MSQNDCICSVNTFLSPPTRTSKSQSSVLERSLLVVFWTDHKFPDGELQYEVAECRVMLLFVPQHPFFQFTLSFRQKRGPLNTGASTTGNLSLACPLIFYFLRPSWTLNIYTSVFFPLVPLVVAVCYIFPQGRSHLQAILQPRKTKTTLPVSLSNYNNARHCITKHYLFIISKN